MATTSRIGSFGQRSPARVLGALVRSGDWPGAALTAAAALLATAVVALVVALLAPPATAVGPRGVQVATAGLVVLALGGRITVEVPRRGIGLDVTVLPLTLTLVLVGVLVALAARRLWSRPLRTEGDSAVVVFALQTGLALALLGVLTALGAHATFRGLGEVGKDSAVVGAGYLRTAVGAFLWALLAVGICAVAVRPGLQCTLGLRRVPRHVRRQLAPVAVAVGLVLVSALALSTLYAGVRALLSDQPRLGVAALVADAPAAGVLGATEGLGVPLQDGDRALLTVGLVLGEEPATPAVSTATQSAADAAQFRFDRAGDLDLADLVHRSVGYVALPVLAAAVLVAAGAVRVARGGSVGWRAALLAGVVLGVALAVAALLATVRPRITGPVIYGGFPVVRPSIGWSFLLGSVFGALGMLVGGLVGGSVGRART